MIIEKLDAIALRVSHLIKKGALVKSLSAIFDALNNYTNAPNEANLKAITVSLETLKTSIESNGWSEIPRTWLLYLEEIGFSPYLGENLYQNVKSAINFSNVSAAQARDEIARIRGEVEKYAAAFDQVVSASKVLRISKDTLSPGSAELGVLLPRGLFDNQLNSFVHQSKELDDLACLFEELATGSRQSPKIHAISTTDPIYFLLISPPATLFLLKVLNMLLTAYEKVLEIRKLRSVIAATLSSELTSKIEQEAQTQVQLAIDKIIPEILREAVIKGDRQNELRNELAIRLPRMASWVDHGVRIEATIVPLPAKKDDEDETQDVANLRDISEKIATLSAKVRRYELAGEPILNLPAPDGKDEKTLV